MATVNSSLPHIDRTAAEPREHQLEPVILSHIREVNDTIRLLRLSTTDPNHTIKVSCLRLYSESIAEGPTNTAKFLPGQWLDTYIPGLRNAGGFTITSTPSEARPSSHSSPYLELAVQKSSNPPAKWLWRSHAEILNTQLTVRVGGSFTWPPQAYDTDKIDRLVLVAGGVGINPLISIFSHLVRIPSHMRPREMHFIYATKAYPDLDRQKILFLPRLMDLVAAAADSNVSLGCYLTGLGEEGLIEHGQLPNRTYGRRLQGEDLVKALDGYGTNTFGADHGRKGTVAYVCGPPRFTDEYVAFLQKQEGMSDDRVLCEKWW